MDKTELGHLLLDGSAEIDALRRRNEVLQAKVDMVDTLAAFLFADVRRASQGAAPDVAWAMRRAAEALKAEA